MMIKTDQHELDEFWLKIEESALEKPFKCLVDELFEQKSCYLFGAAQMAKKFVDICRSLNIRVKGIADNNSNLWGTDIKGIKVISPLSIPQDAIVVVASKYVKDIYRQMIEHSYNKLIPHYALTVYYPEYFPNMAHLWCRDIFIDEREKIEKAYCLLNDQESRKLFLSLLLFRIFMKPEQLPFITDDEYKPAGIWKLSNAESYVDVGAYDGDTLRAFIKDVSSFAHYYAFEPDPKLYLRLQETTKNLSDERIHIYPLGVGAESKEVLFSAVAELHSQISDSGTVEIQIISLDEFLHDKEITSIKVDVEGYETEVIAGAKNIISTQRPKLAISAYHRPTDLWRLLLQIHAINSNYRFYLRHHEPEIIGSVLYCV